MAQLRRSRQGRFDSLDERLKACPDWVRRKFEQLDRTCRRVCPGAKTAEAARNEGRVFYGGASQRMYCRVDPNSKRIGVQFSNAIHDAVAASGMLRNRKGQTWIYVEEDTDLTKVAELIERSCAAVQSKQRGPNFDAVSAASPLSHRSPGSSKMDVRKTVREHGFTYIATLQWKDVGRGFHLEGSRALWRATRHFVYVWIDTDGHRVLNVGHTGQAFSTRFGDYVRWLNGMRKNDCDTPIRHAWLACIRVCQPGNIEIWTRSSAADRLTREMEERQWIARLRPALNRR